MKNIFKFLAILLIPTLGLAAETYPKTHWKGGVGTVVVNETSSVVDFRHFIASCWDNHTYDPYYISTPRFIRINIMAKAASTWAYVYLKHYGLNLGQYTADYNWTDGKFGYEYVLPIYNMYTDIVHIRAYVNSGPVQKPFSIATRCEDQYGVPAITFLSW